MGRLFYSPGPVFAARFLDAADPCAAAMPLPLNNLSLDKLLAAVVASLLLAMASGCQTPPFMPPPHERPESASTSDMSPAIETGATAADKATEADVMSEVQKISAKDPLAGKLLLDELSRAEPKMWPLVVQNFRSRQALHDQLLSKPRRHDDGMEAAADDLVSNVLPSEGIGRLGDPRHIRSDPRLEQAFARATPANMPAPADLAPQQESLIARDAPVQAPEEAARPIAEPTQVVTASGAMGGRVEQAIYSAESEPQSSPEAKLDWQQQLQLAIEDLDQRLVDDPRSTAEVHRVASLRLMNLLAGNTEDALKPLPSVSIEEQDFWSSQVFALATLLDHHRQPDDQRRAAASVVHLDEAVGHLRELGSLAVRNLAFCKNVYGYGAYEPIDNPIFSPGQQVTLYLEVENYHSESTIKGYNTKLAGSYELVNEDGERLAGGDFPNVEDTCQSRRRDFHIQYGLVLPKTAKAGKYRVKLSMNDRQSDKMGSASIALDIR